MKEVFFQVGVTSVNNRTNSFLVYVTYLYLVTTRLCCFTATEASALSSDLFEMIISRFNQTIISTSLKLPVNTYNYIHFV